MAHVFYNPNPVQKLVGDCVIRAICKATDYPWEKVYTDITLKGFELCDMPSSNVVWAAYLKDQGFKRDIVPNECPACYTVNDFCEDHPEGIYILGTGTHVVTVEDGNFFDTWNSGDEVPIYFWQKEE